MNGAPRNVWQVCRRTRERGRARGGSYEDETDEGPRLERAEVMVS